MVGSSAIGKASGAFALLLSAYSWLYCFVVVGQSQTATLPVTTSYYYTAVSGGYGLLNYSVHYREYGSRPDNKFKMVSRYFAPGTQEWMDVSSQLYYLQFPQGVQWNYNVCETFSLHIAQATYPVWPATSFLFNLTTEAIQFTTTPGVTVRSQLAMKYSMNVNYNKGLTYSPSVDSFLQSAYSIAGLSSDPNYIVNLDINVYFAFLPNSVPMTTGDGYTPLRFTINGTRTDNQNTMPIDIVFDFMQWAQLNALAKTKLSAGGCGQDPVSLPTLPTSTQVILNSTLPAWTGGRSILELVADASTSPQVLQLDANFNMSIMPKVIGCVGEEMNAILLDRNQYIWSSNLYTYLQSAVTGATFNAGNVYTITTNILDSASSITCAGANINASNLSPLQWLNGGSLLSIFAQAGFLNVPYTIVDPQPVIRGITADGWTFPGLSNKNSLTGITYSFDLTVYAIASGWNILGRSVVNPMERQLLSLVYTNGKQTYNDGSSTQYTLQMDFFTQHVSPSPQNAQNFRISTWNCKLLQTYGFGYPCHGVGEEKSVSFAPPRLDIISGQTFLAPFVSGVLSVLVLSVVFAIAVFYVKWNPMYANVTTQPLNDAQEHAKSQ